MLIIACSHGKHLAGQIAEKVKCAFSELSVSRFPDNEIHVRFNCDLRNKKAVLVQSFYGEISDCIIEVILAAKTASELGAKEIILVAPYFPYLRQDKRFHRGEAVSQGIIAGLVDNFFDEVLIIDPHLHRKSSMEQIFRKKSKKITANSLMAGYIKNNIPKPIIMGPDEESYKWARSVAKDLGAQFRILRKKRYSSYHVEVKLNKHIDLSGRNVVIVDDIVSTGHTILETAKIIKKMGAKNVHCICVHGIFAGDALDKLKGAGIKTVSTNTVPNDAAKIDVSGIIADGLK